jgi:small subunit ribosomal protein SAe
MATEAHKLHADDVAKFLATQTHYGSNKCNFQMKQYMYARRPDGYFIINVQRTWDKLLLAARAIAAIENAFDVAIIGARPYAQRGLLKYAAHTGATPIAGRFTPGTFTNQIQRAFKEPRLLVIVDPYQDHQAITEASYVNIPVIAFTNSDSPLKMVDIAIPCNNKGKNSIGLMLWMLAREVLVLRGRVARSERGTYFTMEGKVIMPDLYFYRDQDDEDTKDDVAAIDEAPQANWGEATQPDVLGGAHNMDHTLAGAPALGGIEALSAGPLDWAAEAQQWSTPQQAGNADQNWGADGTQW